MCSLVNWDELLPIHTPLLDKWAYADHTFSVWTVSVEGQKKNMKIFMLATERECIYSMYKYFSIVAKQINGQGNKGDPVRPKSIFLYHRPNLLLSEASIYDASTQIIHPLPLNDVIKD